MLILQEVLDDPLRNSNNTTAADPDSVAVDMSVTCTQHSALDSRTSLELSLGQHRNAVISQGFGSYMLEAFISLCDIIHSYFKISSGNQYYI